MAWDNYDFDVSEACQSKLIIGEIPNKYSKISANDFVKFDGDNYDSDLESAWDFKRPLKKVTITRTDFDDLDVIEIDLMSKDLV